MHVTRPMLAAGVAVVALTVPGVALGQAPAAQSDNPARSQVMVFERVLRGSVEAGGAELAKQALIVAPELTLSTEEAIVRGVRLPGYGFYFDVQVPGIEGTVRVWEMIARRRERPGRANPSLPVAAAGTVTDDPMVEAPPMFDPDREYSSHVRRALIDAVVDSSGVLAIGAGERLTVAVSEIDSRNPNPLYRSSPSKLLLSIQGVDLQELRQGRITREQAIERILEDRF